MKVSCQLDILRIFLKVIINGKLEPNKCYDVKIVDTDVAYVSGELI